MQLRAPIGALVLLVAVAAHAPARADSGMTVAATYFHESGGPLSMNVVTPAVNLGVDLDDDVTLAAEYEADIVSGASVAVVDAPAASVDAITSATKLTDTRHTGGGSLQVRGEQTSMTLRYRYGTESDYRSHGLGVSGRAEMFERNTAFELSYARGFDRVCNVSQPRAQEAVDRRRLDASDGCFADDDDQPRISERLSIQTVQGTWTQAWAPILTTQVTLTAQLLSGQQGNPYRAVWLGRTSAQEHHPHERTRYAAGLGARLWIRPLSGALQLEGRVYRDTWGIESVTGEAGYEQSVGEGLRLRVRGRYYTQTGAVFFSDDYALRPAGQYFTGDRELSPMQSVTLGGRITWSVPADEEGDVLGFLTQLDLVAKADYIMHTFDEFHYGRADVPNTDALLVTLALESVF
jgi:hypothetical protein